MPIDFHTHSKDHKEYTNQGLKALVNCMTPKEADYWLDVSKSQPGIKVSIGVHPDRPDQFDALKAYYGQAHVIGEIGLDNVWATSDLEDQRRVFKASLDLAVSLNKPVILHTKGMAEEIFSSLQAYDMVKIIHWYSDDIDLVKKYPMTQAYFTIGPDVLINPKVRALVDYLSVDQLLIETDGLDAVRWALGDCLSSEDLPQTLRTIILYICQTKQVSEEDFLRHLNAFFDRL